MKLELRKKEDCTFDMISLGEIMLRLDPGDARIRTATPSLSNIRKTAGPYVLSISTLLARLLPRASPTSTMPTPRTAI